MSGRRSSLEDFRSGSCVETPPKVVKVCENKRPQTEDSDHPDRLVPSSPPASSTAAESDVGIDQDNLHSKPSVWSQLLAGGWKLAKAAVLSFDYLLQKLKPAHTDHSSCYTAPVLCQPQPSNSDLPSGTLRAADYAEMVSQDRKSILQASMSLGQKRRKLVDDNLEQGEVGQEEATLRSDMQEQQESVIKCMLEIIMTKGKGLPKRQAAIKLKFLQEVEPLLHDGDKLIGVSLHEKPLIADLPWVARCFDDYDTLHRVNISDGSLAAVSRYTKSSATAEDLPGVQLLGVFKEFGASILSQSVEPVVHCMMGPQESSFNMHLFMKDVRDIVNTAARNVVQEMFSKRVAASILDDLSQRLHQLEITPLTGPLDVQWKLTKQDGAVVVGRRAPRHALWLSDENKLLITVPKIYACPADLQIHVQQIALELARFVMANIPWSALETRLLAQELLDVVSLDLFKKEYPVDISQLFQKVASEAQQLAGSPANTVSGFDVFVRWYFTAVQELLPALDFNQFLGLRTWVTCKGKQLNIARFANALEGILHLFTSGRKPLQLPLLVEGKLIQLLLQLLWLHGELTDQSGVSGEWSVHLLLLTTLVTLGWISNLIDDMKKYGRQFDILLSSKTYGNFYVEVKSTHLLFENEASRYFFLSEKEFERAKAEGPKYMLVRVFGTPVSADFNKPSDLKFLFIKDPVQQLIDGHLERRDDPRYPGSVGIYIGEGVQRPRTV